MEWKSKQDTVTNHWHAIPMERNDQITNQNGHTVQGIDTRDLDDWALGGEIKCYVWNPNHEPLTIEFMILESYGVNPLRYGLFNPIDPENIRVEKGTAKKLF